MILAQLGAHVIKGEMPGSGDDSRTFGPFVKGKSLYFSSLNYDKQSIALDLKEPVDREILEGLLGISDVVIENFRPGTMEKAKRTDRPRRPSQDTDDRPPHITLSPTVSTDPGNCHLEFDEAPSAPAAGAAGI